MKSVARKNTESQLRSLERLTEELRDKAQTLGITVAAVDSSGDWISPFRPDCALCRSIDPSGSRCPEDMQQVVRSVLSDNEPVVADSLHGCCLIGIPIRRRRRLAGAIIAGYVPVEMMNSPAFAEASHADSGPEPRHRRDQAHDFLNVLNWLMESIQNEQVNQQELSTLSNNLVTTYEELSLLYRISGTMKVTQQHTDFLAQICAELQEVMNISCAVAQIYSHPPAEEEDSIVLAGDVELNREQLKLLTATRIAPKIAERNRPLLLNGFQAPEGSGLGNKVQNLIAAPLTKDKEVIGLLVGLNKHDGDFDSVDLKLINSIANQSAVFLTNNRLYADLEDLLMGVLHALTSSIDAKDPYTSGHSQRVAELSRKISEKLGLPEAKIERIYLCGLLHDIGKIGVPEAVLCKPGRLTDEEYEIIKRHPRTGERILAGIRQLEDIVPGVVSHHERYDGRGYPDGLHGQEIPLEGRIVGLADVFDAMSSDRTYRRALPLEKITEEIERCAGTQFDPNIAKVVLELDLARILEEFNNPAGTVFPARLQKEKQE
ncbi:MAG: HD domain-containing phosphohydrolase [Phycisphaerae bacterium]